MAKRFVTLVAAGALTLGLLAQVAAVSAAGSNILTAKLAGSHEVAPVATAGTGSVRVAIVGDGSSIFYQVSYSGLSGPVVASHIHVGDIGANGPVLFPLTPGPNPMSGTLTAAAFTGANGLTYTQALDAIRSGGTYVNLHTAKHPGGEVRGQLYDAQAQPTYTIVADAPQAVPQGRLWVFNDYFPRTLTVTSGAILKFVNAGFHTSTLLPAGMTAAQDNAANGIAAPDLDDTALNPNGTTHVVQNLGALAPTPADCGTDANPCLFDGTSIINEPVSLGPPTDPRAIRIEAPPGQYVFHCRLHPDMVGWLNVVSDGVVVSSPDDLAADSARQIAADVAAGWTAQKAADRQSGRRNRDGTTTWTVSAGTDSPGRKVSILEFLPARVNAKPGDRIRFLPKSYNEPHTVTFPEYLGTDTAIVCEGDDGDTPAVPIVNPPTGPQDFGCEDGSPPEFEIGGGNGVSTLTSPTTVSDSGLVFRAGAEKGFGLPASAALPTWTATLARTATAGTYHFVCQFHDGMAGDIVVK